MNSVATFLDDIMALSQSTFTTHLAEITEVLKRLLAAGIQVNAAKCKWFNHAVTYLGFVITRSGIQPQPKKIQGILNMKAPKTQKEVQCFVGMVNFYRNLYSKRAELLAPLTDLCGQNKKIVWSTEHDEAFAKIKQQMAQETMLTYPQFDQPFVFCTDASESKTEALSLRMESHSAFLAGNLPNFNVATFVTEQELLAITETLKYYKHMLFGHKIIVKTDHKNLIHQVSSHASDRVLRQCLLLEEYGVELKYIKGESRRISFKHGTHC
jgi:hypothetical protein